LEALELAHRGEGGMPEQTIIAARTANQTSIDLVLIIFEHTLWGPDMKKNPAIHREPGEAFRRWDFRGGTAKETRDNSEARRIGFDIVCYFGSIQQELGSIIVARHGRIHHASPYADISEFHGRFQGFDRGVVLSIFP